MQDLVEATSTVKKRLDFIAAELGRVDERLNGLEEKAEKKQAAVAKIQSDITKLKQQST